MPAAAASDPPHLNFTHHFSDSQSLGIKQRNHSVTGRPRARVHQLMVHLLSHHLRILPRCSMQAVSPTANVSVCPSVCLSVCHSVNCDKTNESSAEILIPHER